MNNYSSMDGVLYCKPHFEQLFKETGSFSKNFRTSSFLQYPSLTRLNFTLFIYFEEIINTVA